MEEINVEDARTTSHAVEGMQRYQAMEDSPRRRRKETDIET